MANLAKMKTAAQAGGLLQEPGANSPNAVGQITEVAKAFGLNMPEMTKEQNRLLEQLADAKAEAQQANNRADLGRLEAQIEGFKNSVQQGNQANDPLKDMAVEMAKSALQKTQGPGDDDPVASAYKQFIMNKTLSDLEMSQSPPSVSDQVGSAVETLRAIKELSVAFSPPAPAVAPSMSPERNYELELEKLKIEQQIEMYRIQKQTEADERKANGYQEAIKMIGSAFEGIGKNIADQLVSNNEDYAPQTPASVNRVSEEQMVNVSDIDEDDDSNPLVGKMTCPDCGQDAVYITKEMYDMGQQQIPVDAACVACGAQHTLGDPGEEISSDPLTAPVQPPAFSQPEEPSAQRPSKKGVHAEEIPSRTIRNGKVRPPRRNFVSVD
jgi:DNA-directed RNA polymerase subunit M/transcription elongation factor TFIIS|tara:strand:+ start:2964 stop:4109 length:1146 start_codon:yes stop_codon:yes gene_type:complete